MVRAIGMLSGGLDSTLACRLLMDQGIEIIGVNFSTGFCSLDVRRAVRRARDDGKDLSNPVLKTGARYSVPVHVIDIAEEYFREVLLKPRYGFGANLNPCIDCRIFMFRKAKDLMTAWRADFIFTGEVLDQRPMSQHMEALKLIEKESELEGLILRPLSAHHLPPTIPEREGWVNRERLLGIRGRQRNIQMRLAEQYGIEDYPTPAGGCCALVDPSFAEKLQDLLVNQPTTSLAPDLVVLLKVGRYFRLDSRTVLIVGREQAENEFLERYANRFVCLAPVGVKGATALILSEKADERILDLATRIIARYSKALPGNRVDVRVAFPDGRSRILQAIPMSEPDLAVLRVS